MADTSRATQSPLPALSVDRDRHSPAPAPWRLPRSQRRPMLIGLVASILLYLAFSVAHAYMLPIYRPGDERRHTKYVVVLESKDRLPTMRETRAASHPPLYYGLIAKTVMRGVTSTKGIGDQVRRGRLVSVAFGALALVFAFLNIRLLLPRSPAIAVHATAVIAVIPSYANVCAVLANDSLGLAAQLALIYAAMVVLLRGPTTGRLLHVGLWLSVAALTRLSSALVIPAAMVAVFAGVGWHRRGSVPRRLGAALWISGILAASVALTAGWFYWRNWSSHGDVSGQAAAFKQFRRHPVEALSDVIVNADHWLELHDELWGRLAGQVYLKGAVATFARWMTALSIAGAALALLRARVWRYLARCSGAEVSAWVVTGGVYATVMLSVFMYHARGGGLHQRYMFGALYVIGLVMALGLSWSKRQLAPAVGFGAVFVMCFADHITYAARLTRKIRRVPFEHALGRGVEQSELATMVLLATLALGLAGVMYGLVRLHRRLEPPDR